MISKRISSFFLALVLFLATIASAFDIWIYSPQDLAEAIGSHVIPARLSSKGATPVERSSLVQLHRATPADACTPIEFDQQKSSFAETVIMINSENCEIDLKIRNILTATNQPTAIIIKDKNINSVERKQNEKYFEGSQVYDVPVILINHQQAEIIESYLNSSDPFKNHVVLELKYFLNKLASYEFSFHLEDDHSYKFAEEIQNTILSTDLVNYVDIQPVFPVSVPELCAKGLGQCSAKDCFFNKYCHFPGGDTNFETFQGKKVLRHEIYLKCLWHIDQTSFWDFLQEYKQVCFDKDNVEDSCIDESTRALNPLLFKKLQTCFNETFLSKSVEGGEDKWDSIILQGEAGKRAITSKPVVFSDHSRFTFDQVVKSGKSLKDLICHDLDRYYFAVPACHGFDGKLAMVKYWVITLALPIITTLAIVYIYMQKKELQRKYTQLYSDYTRISAKNDPVLKLEMADTLKEN